MTLSEFKLQNLSVRKQELPNSLSTKYQNSAPTQNTENAPSFRELLETQLAEKSSVPFSSHALKRLESRQIDMSDDVIARLNKAVSIAADKGSNDALVLVDNSAFIVSVKNQRVITAMTGSDLRENIFTDIDSTVIM